MSVSCKQGSSVRQLSHEEVAARRRKRGDPTGAAREVSEPVAQGASGAGRTTREARGTVLHICRPARLGTTGSEALPQVEVKVPEPARSRTGTDSVGSDSAPRSLRRAEVVLRSVSEVLPIAISELCATLRQCGAFIPATCTAKRLIRPVTLVVRPAALPAEPAGASTPAALALTAPRRDPCSR